ncbi:MAG: hypothetical protein ABIQ27_12930 [Flavobacterium sp.]|uniref:hypothetical protein n=1 Tax=Flavobacterium sp. TaxID=239 RepID=UPI003267E81C
MAIIDFPNNSKWVVGQTRYVITENGIVSAIISKVKIVVTDIDLNGIAEQTNKYIFSSLPGREFDEDKVFRTLNLVFKYIKGGYLNPRINSILFNQNGQDLSGWDFTDADISGNELIGQIVDGANFTNAVLPIGKTTKGGFVDELASYDPVSTIWTDGNPIGIVAGTEPAENTTPTKYQVGQTRYFVLNERLLSAEIERIQSEITQSGQTNFYYFKNFTKQFSETEIFGTENLTLAFLRGEQYLNTIKINASNTGIGSDSDDYSAYDFTDTDFGETNFADKYVNGSNFTGAVMPANADTPQEFADLIAEFDENTIWINGQTLISEL